eukprot:m.214559 g.214559  ORF g.214559 m.214559 type:complete len:166 (+) comp27224_c0_seq1:388-885(+)
MRVDDHVLYFEQVSLGGHMNKMRAVRLRDLSVAEVSVAFKQVWVITLLIGLAIVVFGIAVIFCMPKAPAAVLVWTIFFIGVIFCVPGLCTLVSALRYKKKTCVSVSFFEAGASCSTTSGSFFGDLWMWITGGTKEQPVIQFTFDDVAKASADDFMRHVMMKAKAY